MSDDTPAALPTDLRALAPGLPPRVTIADVARVAGVSKATVSRFFNHRDKLLSPAIAAKVEKAVAELAYSPSPMAQALKRGRTRLVGLVVADVTNPFSVAVLRGAEQACQRAGYLLMLFNLGNDSSREGAAIEALASYQVEGFILNTLGVDGGAVTETARHGKPVVLIDRRHEKMHADFVSLDNDAAMALACDHLHAAGYRELLFVSEPVAGVSSRRERAAAFERWVEAHPDARGTCIESAEDAPAALDEHIAALRARAGARPPAVVASNAVISLRVAAALAARQWRLGPDVGLLGFDDTDWAPLVGPGLTTIAQPTDDLGRLAADCLLERLRGEDPPPRRLLLPGELKVRGSTRTGG